MVSANALTVIKSPPKTRVTLVEKEEILGRFIVVKAPEKYRA
jgi:hypothetical protein